MKKILLTSVLFILLTACAKNERYIGYNFDNNHIENIKVGATTEMEVLEKFGTPTTKTSFADLTYYYIAFKQSNTAFFQPKNDEQLVLEVVFNKQKVVQKVETYTLSHANDIGYVEESTELKGNKLSPIQQIMQNVGKFNTPKSGASKK